MTDQLQPDTFTHEWDSFTHWLTDRGVDPSLPIDANPVALSEAGHAPGKIDTALRAIRDRHERAALPSPTEAQSVRKVHEALVRPGSHVPHVLPLTDEGLEAIRNTACRPRPVGRGRETPERAHERGLVDIALVSVIRDALLRASEAVNTGWGDISRCADGSGMLIVHCLKLGECCGGHSASLSPRTMEALEAIWPDPCDDDSRVFAMHPRNVTMRIRRMTRAAGLGDGYSAHSPRIGMMQDLVEAGFSIAQIAVFGRWHNPHTIHRNIPQAYIPWDAVPGSCAQQVGDDKVESRRLKKTP